MVIATGMQPKSRATTIKTRTPINNIVDNITKTGMPISSDTTTKTRMPINRVTIKTRTPIISDITTRTGTPTSTRLLLSK